MYVISFIGAVIGLVLILWGWGRIEEYKQYPLIKR